MSWRLVVALAARRLLPALLALGLGFLADAGLLDGQLAEALRGILSGSSWYSPEPTQSQGP